LKNELDKLEEWERILLLMRGQNMPYGEISKYVDKPERQLKVYYARLKKQMTEKINEQLNNLKNV
jgi:DNA-directed RNA polymerase specialized sigma24 family protein